MLTRLSKNSFVRIYDEGAIGYINNQLTKHDRIYNETGADFLKLISREPQEINCIVDRLAALYKAPREELDRDFREFVDDLAQHKFLVTGSTPKECDSNDLEFSYSMDNPKTLVDDYTQKTAQKVTEDSQSFYLKHDLRTPRMTSLQFELTSRCNERCIHCYIPNGKKNTGFDMPLERVKDLIDQFAKMNGLHVTLSGGEALLHKDIAEILRYCRAKDLQISLLTNLALLKDELIPVLKEVNLSLIQVSLYSMDPEIHDTITTVKGSWAKTKAAIEKLHAADVPVQISCPIMKANKKGYDKVLQYARDLKMKAMTDYIMMAQADLDTQNLANRIDIEETREVIQDIIDWDRQYDELVHDVEPFSSLSKEELAKMPLCGAGLNDICVTVNGDLYPCAGWQAMVVGNIYKQTLKEVWENSPELAKIRKITRGDFSKCLECKAKDFCNMCLVRNFNESGGDMFKTNDHFCKVAFLNMQMAEEQMNIRKNKNKQI